MERKIDSELDIYYYSKNDRKVNGIYCQQLDRWVLIDCYDIWITFKTAQTLSSKIATAVYILPENKIGMTNNNCMNYSIFDKTEMKRRNVSELLQNQTPTLKRLSSKNLIKAGLPEEFKDFEGLEYLQKLKQFTEYVNKIVYGIEICNARAWADNTTIPNTYFPNSWIENISTYHDRTNSKKGFFGDFYPILYFSNSIEEARQSINSLVLQNIDKKLIPQHVVSYFYGITEEPLPF